jgi:hypothetical protein
MKRSVGNSAYAPGWQGSDYAPSGKVRRIGGRVRRPRDLYGSMMLLAGLVYLADFFSLVDLWAPIEFFMAGIVLGVFAGREIVVWRERREGELHPDLVREIERTWTLLGVAVFMLMLLLQAALA